LVRCSNPGVAGRAEIVVQDFRTASITPAEIAGEEYE